MFAKILPFWRLRALENECGRTLCDHWLPMPSPWPRLFTLMLASVAATLAMDLSDYDEGAVKLELAALYNVSADQLSLSADAGSIVLSVTIAASSEGPESLSEILAAPLPMTGAARRRQPPIMMAGRRGRRARPL